MKKLASAMFVLAFLLAGSPASALDPGLDQVDPQITDGTAGRQFKAAREQWLKQGIDDYRMTVRRACFCLPPSRVKVTVRDGKPVSLSARPWSGPRTVPGMFRIVGQAIKRKVAKLDVRYNARLGLPARTSIDYIAMAVDDEIGYQIKGFKRLKD